MGQSLVKNYLHIVFSTKYRQPLIKEFIEDELYRYLGGVCKELECQPIKIGGYYDHLHILCMLSKKIALMKLLEEVKSHSSKWIKTKHESLKNFYWQDACLPVAIPYLNFVRVKILRFFDINICNAQNYHEGFSAFELWRYPQR
jgi:REP element-mobilizing transposase RayT